MCVVVFVYLVNKFLLSTYKKPDTDLRAKERPGNKINKILP